MKTTQLLDFGSNILRSKKIVSHRIDSEVILSYILKISREKLLIKEDKVCNENIIKLAIDGGCNAVASTFGVLASCSRKYAHKIPFVVKLNHNEFLTYPETYSQISFGSVEEAWNLGATAVGATIYFGSDDSNRQIVEIA